MKQFSALLWGYILNVTMLQSYEMKIRNLLWGRDCGRGVVNKFLFRM